MIITCPQCDIRFVVPSTIFMRGARKLRCSTCKHTWMQEEPLEKKTDTPIIDNDDNQTDADKKSKIEMIKNDFKNGYGLIGGVCALVLIIFFGFKMMMPSLIVGQGLAFDNITIERNGTTLNIAGEIVNAVDSDRGVPSIIITQILANDIEGDTTIMSPVKDVLRSGEVLPMNASLNDVGPEVVNVKLGFNPVQDKTEETNLDDHSGH